MTELIPPARKRVSRVMGGTSAGAGARPHPCGVLARRPQECASGAQELSALERVKQINAETSGFRRNNRGESSFRLSGRARARIDTIQRAKTTINSFRAVSDVKGIFFFVCRKEARRRHKPRGAQITAVLPYAPVQAGSATLVPAAPPPCDQNKETSYQRSWSRSPCPTRSPAHCATPREHSQHFHPWDTLAEMFTKTAGQTEHDNSEHPPYTPHPRWNTRSVSNLT